MPRTLRACIHVAGICNAYAVVAACADGSWGAALWHGLLVLWLAISI